MEETKVIEIAFCVRVPADLTDEDLARKLTAALTPSRAEVIDCGPLMLRTVEQEVTDPHDDTPDLETLRFTPTNPWSAPGQRPAQILFPSPAPSPPSQGNVWNTWPGVPKPPDPPLPPPRVPQVIFPPQPLENRPLQGPVDEVDRPIGLPQKPTC